MTFGRAKSQGQRDLHLNCRMTFGRAKSQGQRDLHLNCRMTDGRGELQGQRSPSQLQDDGWKGRTTLTEISTSLRLLRGQNLKDRDLHLNRTVTVGPRKPEPQGQQACNSSPRKLAVCIAPEQQPSSSLDRTCPPSNAPEDIQDVFCSSYIIILTMYDVPSQMSLLKQH